MRRLPPIFPPFFPIADIICEISALVRIGEASGLVDSCPMTCDPSFTSAGRFDFLMRFGMLSVWHEPRARSRWPSDQSSPLPGCAHLRAQAEASHCGRLRTRRVCKSFSLLPASLTFLVAQLRRRRQKLLTLLSSSAASFSTSRFSAGGPFTPILTKTCDVGDCPAFFT